MSTNRKEDFSKFVTGRSARDWVGGFLLVGVQVGLLGSLLVVWQYHIDTDPEVVGLHFLVLVSGYLVAAAAADWLLERTSIRSVSLTSCAVGFGGLLSLSFLAPPIPIEWRLLGVAFVGAAGGLLMTSLLYAIEPFYKEVPAAAVNLAGMMFGLGCLVATMIVALTYYAGSVRIQAGLLAVIPAIYFVVYLLNRDPMARQPVRSRQTLSTSRDTLRDLRSVAGVLFTLLLFFQFGNEWAIAGWLPLFLIHRLGSNPETAIWALALYFGALMLGRIFAQALLPRVNHRKLLIGSIVLAMIGYLALSFTDSMLGALTAVAVIGAGFAPIYPLIAEKLDNRFAFQPRVYNGVFAMAITGGMSAPWLLGYVAAALGMRYVMLVPALGSTIVLILALLIMLESYLMGGAKQNSAGEPMTPAGQR
ncbi:MAG TPA: MFS transporter [Bryobacteraceae bacterium]|nr:MFS transporter [Bryobacteraceae bacterium]